MNRTTACSFVSLPVIASLTLVGFSTASATLPASVPTRDATPFKPLALRDTDLHLIRNVGFGGTGSEYGRASTADARGVAYIAGFTDSTDLPTRNPTQAAYGGG